MKGAIDVVLRHCTSIPDGSALTDKEKQLYFAKVKEFGYKGLRGMYFVF